MMRIIGLVLVVTLCLVSGGWLIRPPAPADGGGYQQSRLFQNVLTAINRHYLDSLGEGELYQRAAGALVSSLHDPYAELLVKDSYREYQRQMAGTRVDVVVEDGSVGRRVTRTEIHVPAPARARLFGAGVGYVALRRLSEGAAAELRQTVDSLVDHGMSALVLDLRSNPGGLINEGVRVAGLFLEPGDTVATSEGRSARHSRAYVSPETGGWDRLRLAVLVDKGTASSAELVAGALQDHDRAVLVGTPTYGKGVLQTTYPLGEEVAIKLTTARWFTPSGRTVQRPRPEAGGPGNRPAGQRPRVFRTAAGRPLPDPSGILPDLTVRVPSRQLETAVGLLRQSRSQADAVSAAATAQTASRER